MAASLLADALTGDLPASPLARARCADGVAAQFPARAARVKAGLKDPCAILAREAALRAVGGVVGGGGRNSVGGVPVDPASLASGAPVESGGLKTPVPTPARSVSVNATAPRARNGTAPTTGLLWVRRNETLAGDIVV